MKFPFWTSFWTSVWICGISGKANGDDLTNRIHLAYRDGIARNNLALVISLRN